MEHPYPDMVEIYKANKEHVTAAAIFEGVEMVSGFMPQDDYKVAWISADGWNSARTELKDYVTNSAKTCPKSWVKRMP